jgi:hypothetical protein
MLKDVQKYRFRIDLSTLSFRILDVIALRVHHLLLFLPFLPIYLTTEMYFALRDIRQPDKPPALADDVQQAYVHFSYV